MAKLVSKTYGEALFSLAVEEQKIDLFLEEITGIQSVLKANEDFSRLMNHPKVIKEEKVLVLTNVFKGRISDEMLGFLTLIVTKDRYSDINDILDYFLTEVKAFKGIGVAYVTTAIEIGADKKKEIEARLLSITTYKTMEMHFDVDTGLIGGMVIRIKDRVVDSSVKTKLFELQRQLQKVQI